MLQNASIKTKLAAILILPLLSLGVLAGMRVGDNLTRGRQADRMHEITTFALSLSAWCTSSSASGTCPPGTSAAARPAATAA
jgi:hypothetical protein